MKKQAFLFVILFVAAGLFLGAVTGGKDFKDINRLIKQKEYAKALELMDKTEKTLTGSDLHPKLLALKTQTLVKMNRLEDAFKTAVKRTEVSERKSPWHCLDVTAICLRMHDMDRAFQWLDKAVDRGFLSYTELYDEPAFSALTKDKRLDKVIRTIKDKIGVGKPVKDFTVELFRGAGKKFVLSEYKGKVVLIDFWATWCPPCVKGIKHLKEFYPEYKDKGFEIIGISLDSKRELVEKYLEKEKLPWLISYSGDAWGDRMAKRFSVNLIPSYWLIDRKGNLRHFGIPLRDKETMHKAIAALTAEKK